MPRDINGDSLVPGYNVEKINPEKGIKLLHHFGYTDDNTTMLIHYCLMRWARGEEYAAEKMAIDTTFSGIPFTDWRAVLAAAMEK